ncbi:hypothetical protein [Litorihabitans aurantiacus]|uniref:Uncharacterized protein n=1 Tax=Litorihabitans aurantiacus TaxID=1930061 RepID=A0AA38CSL3_9MICO|nr:hypothetical protein [Litorihabitans aurantiacus]GMA33533.1 hypothetical protein GCM10025875_35250 [Litorihabitans aurantiacus]GMA33615.1 hypothetical protein GCM10025875_36070 [Litorihabitans aurantiacus]
MSREYGHTLLAEKAYTVAMTELPPSSLIWRTRDSLQDWEIWTAEAVIDAVDQPDGLDLLAHYDHTWKPEGWLADPEERAAWIERFGDDKFFWPKTGHLFKSRSSAVRLARLLESYGAVAEVLTTEVVWETDETRRERRDKAKRDARAAKLRDELAALEAEK